MALVTLYYSTNGHRFWEEGPREKWLKAENHECDWDNKAECTSGGRYKELKMRRHNLTGTFPSERAANTTASVHSASRPALTGIPGNSCVFALTATYPSGIGPGGVFILIMNW